MFDILLPLSCSLVEGTGHLTLPSCSHGCTTPHTRGDDYPDHRHDELMTIAKGKSSPLSPSSDRACRHCSFARPGAKHKIRIAKPAKKGKNGSSMRHLPNTKRFVQNAPTAHPFHFSIMHYPFRFKPTLTFNIGGVFFQRHASFGEQERGGAAATACFFDINRTGGTAPIGSKDIATIVCTGLCI